jgi:hypothetical protein
MSKLLHRFYILDERGECPVHCDNIEQWMDWYLGTVLRRVDKSFLGAIFISTIFLGIDHSFGDNQSPVLWETMVFRMEDNEIAETLECERCNGNREQALAMHAGMVDRVEALLGLGLELTPSDGLDFRY